MSGGAHRITIEVDSSHPAISRWEKDFGAYRITVIISRKAEEKKLLDFWGPIGAHQITR